MILQYPLLLLTDQSKKAKHANEASYTPPRADIVDVMYLTGATVQRFNSTLARLLVRQMVSPNV